MDDALQNFPYLIPEAMKEIRKIMLSTSKNPKMIHKDLWELTKTLLPECAEVSAMIRYRENQPDISGSSCDVIQVSSRSNRTDVQKK